MWWDFRNSAWNSSYPRILESGTEIFVDSFLLRQILIKSQKLYRSKLKKLPDCTNWTEFMHYCINVHDLDRISRSISELLSGNYAPVFHGKSWPKCLPSAKSLSLHPLRRRIIKTVKICKQSQSIFYNRPQLGMTSYSSHSKVMESHPMPPLWCLIIGASSVWSVLFFGCLSRDLLKVIWKSFFFFE